MMRATKCFRVTEEDELGGYSLDAQRQASLDYRQQRNGEPVDSYNEEGGTAHRESPNKPPEFRHLPEPVDPMWW